MNYSLFRDDQGYWLWRLLSADNIQLALAGARYRTQHECLAAVAQVKQSTDSRIMVAQERAHSLRRPRAPAAAPERLHAGGPVRLTY